jgi:hypothetical protein
METREKQKIKKVTHATGNSKQARKGSIIVHPGGRAWSLKDVP